MSDQINVDARQVVRWAYCFFLGREPENEGVIDEHLAADGGALPASLRSRIMHSSEFIGVAREAGLALVSIANVVDPVFLAKSPKPVAGRFMDRFGVQTRTSFLPAPYQRFAGLVGSADGVFDMPVHEPEELSSLLRSVAEARGHFGAVELGAGWGPWIILGAKLAARRGLPCTLMGVEGSSDHVQFMHEHCRDNGVDPGRHHIIHAIAGAQDGVAHFPKLTDPSGNWGAEADFGEGTDTGSAFETVSCLSLGSLLDRMPIVDFLHCDVQGAEADVFTAGIEIANVRVRRTCIGTHGRAVEARLLDLMAQNGWELEVEKPCKVKQTDDSITLVADGLQSWRNSRALA